MKNRNAIQRYKTKKNIKSGTIKSINNQCLKGWYCFDVDCNECLPNHVKLTDNSFTNLINN